MRGLLLVISGPSGAGKGTIVSNLIKNNDYELSVSATTRERRRNEVNGIHYFFKTKEEFSKMIENEELLEWAEFLGNFYGTPKKYVEEQLAAGKNVILEIEVNGAAQIKEKVPEALMVFIMAPDFKELEARLIKRATDSEQAIIKRIKRAKEEIKYVDEYDFVVVNRDVAESVSEIETRVQCELKKRV